MANRLRPLAPLEDAQLAASSPRDHAALSASAGTGKTHVLTARVLRLLLSGVDPSSILCLTFTKAGAAEMADRIHARMAYWVRLKDNELGRELAALGEDPGPASRKNARTLFARVLDARGGGLRIQTIHAFAQSLLAAFPAEAGVVPGFRPLEGREEQLLARSTLADLLVRAEREGDLALIRDMQALSHRLGETGAEQFLLCCARAPAAMEALGAREGIGAQLRRAFGFLSGDIEEAIAGACCDDVFDMATLGRIAEANSAWGSATGLNCADLVAAWRGRAPAERAETLSDIAEIVLTKSGDTRKISGGLLKVDPDYADHAARLVECCRRLLAMRKVAALSDCLAAGLRAGQTYAQAYAAAKRAAGLVDFDDLIRWAERLLLTPGMGEWVRYKLDQRTDHILVDEAQDTNERQWNIVRAIALEYFAGQGARQAHRTIFTVGDYKQAIFGFQGTNPDSFDTARAWFSREAGTVDRDFLDLSMDRSFRSAPPILRLVDRVIADLGHQAFGLSRRPNPHDSAHKSRPGSVVLWQPFTAEGDADLSEGAGDEGWIGEATRRYAARLARQVKSWLDRPFFVAARGRPLRPEDILILVRRRGDLASLLVARLHAEGVPVAGVDRLLLSTPLAVQDLLAAARFAVQPLDDLNLAALLVSPLFGWSQDELFDVAFERSGTLWEEVRAGTRAGTVERLHEILAMADFTTPYDFFETLLSGPLDGRRRLMERLGLEARDPVAELLSSALDFEASGTLSLQRFLDWFARGDVEIVRDPSAPLDAVRVMTVHGSKGLQSPILILADACADPERARGNVATFQLPDGGPCVPIFQPRKDELAEPLQSQIAAREAREREEHWRLLYVALTRAEERLYIGGALGPADRGTPPKTSWYCAVDASLDGLAAEWGEDEMWGRARRFGEAEVSARATAKPTGPVMAEPEWLRTAAPNEARPARPLAPSHPGDDDSSNPPPTPELRHGALRGKWLHALFERLPAVPPADRAGLAEQWLERSVGIASPELRASLVADACRIIADPDHGELFSPAAFAEAPIAAVVREGHVVSGTVDRLLVEKDRIVVADFKTGRAVPADAGAIPTAHLRQMAAYSAALRVIFPGRRVEAKLLYTSGPCLHHLDEALLASFAPGGG
jgi:ATP-dependent helicase/nuclease subunit A